MVMRSRCSCARTATPGAPAPARAPIEGFTKCPAAAELAASWGLDLPDGGGGGEEGDTFFLALDLYVSCNPPEVAGGGWRLKREALGHQLAEMVQREAETAHRSSSTRI